MTADYDLGARVAELEKENAWLRRIARDWLNTLCADGFECTCEEDDVCPACRCIAALAGEVKP